MKNIECEYLKMMGKMVTRSRWVMVACLRERWLWLVVLGRKSTDGRGQDVKGVFFWTNEKEKMKEKKGPSSVGETRYVRKGISISRKRAPSPCAHVLSWSGKVIFIIPLVLFPLKKTRPSLTRSSDQNTLSLNLLELVKLFYNLGWLRPWKLLRVLYQESNFWLPTNGERQFFLWTIWSSLFSSNRNQGKM